MKPLGHDAFHAGQHVIRKQPEDFTAMTISETATDFFLPELAHHLATAQHELDEHVNDHGLCAICSSAWPCERAVLADLALSAL